MRESVNDYIRVGTTYYKLIEKIEDNGQRHLVLKPWSLPILKLDFHKEDVKRIRKFDGFTIEPAHVDYHRECGKFYNKYEPISHIPCEGDWRHVGMLVRHIFGDQYELGMDYLQLLYRNPKQLLPIVLLVSSERGTGKTTFLNFLKEVFQENATFNTNDNFGSRFNSDWDGKLLIMIDETSLNRRDHSERLKNMSTARSFKSESKGKDKVEVGFYGKFVMCSNNESRPVFIDKEEIRYWVRRVSRLDSDDTDFLEKLKQEIPAFLHFLLHRDMSTAKESRMWFAPDKIHTAALDKIILACRNPVESAMIDLFEDIMRELGSDNVKMQPQDVVNLLCADGDKADKTTVRRILHENWGLDPAPNSLSYDKVKRQFLPGDRRFDTEKDKGRYYTVTSEMLSSMKF